MSYYKILKTNSVVIKNNSLIINSKSLKNLSFIENDVDFNNAIDKEGHFLLSGGGTFLINKRYLVVLKRAAFAKVNPNKLSIFTGRSDSIEEILNPSLLLRELFEELIIYSANSLLYPKSKVFQDLIDSTYKNLYGSGVIETKNNVIDMNIVNINSSNCIIIDEKRHMIDFHINKNRDINVLFLFDVELNLSETIFKDGEFHIENNEKVFHNRDIYLVDIKENLLIDPKTKTTLPIEQLSKSEHLDYILKNLNKKVKNENNC